MGATSDELMDIARAGAERIDCEPGRLPNIADVQDGTLPHTPSTTGTG